MNKEFTSNPYWDSSLKSFSFNDNDKSASLIKETLEEWYKAKHRKTSCKEIELINSKMINNCPYCNSENIISYGYYQSGMKMRLCKDCGKRFSPISNTIFDSKKIPISEWIEYLLHLFEYHSITTSARDNRNAYSTGKYWLIKVFSVLRNIQNDVILDGEIIFDETFFPVIKSKTIIKSDGKKYRGISRNKICVACGVDNNDNMVIIVENTSKPSFNSTYRAMGNHIKPYSHLIHDDEKSHKILIEKLSLTESSYKADSIKYPSDRDNPLYRVNHLHFLIKDFMKEHGGYNRDDLQDWMNLIWFILSKPYDRYEKINKFLNLAIMSSQRVKYRDVMSKKINK